MSEKGNKKTILNLVMVACIVILVLCLSQIIYSVVEYKKAEDKRGELDSIIDVIGSTAATETAGKTEPTVTETSATELSEVTPGTASGTETEPVTETTEPAPVPREQYRAIWEQISSMKEQYPDLFGWIYIKFDEKHEINLPVMQGDDNSFYILHAYDGTPSKAGSICADYRNFGRKIDFNQNVILYGHHMNDGSMFAQIATKYKVRENFDNVPIVFYSMEGVYTFNVFSIYNAKADDDFNTIAFSQEGLKAFCLEKQRKSFFSKKLTFDEGNTIMTLVTCTNFGSDGRVIVHGVLDSYDPFFD